MATVEKRFDATLRHATDHRDQPVEGWHWSEKLDGCRGHWNGSQLLSRSGLAIRAPEILLAGLPAGVVIDLELYAGCGQREAARRAVQLNDWGPAVHLVCFDLPGHPGDWLQRIESARDLGLAVPDHGTDDGTGASIDAALARVLARGGEGLILHRPGITWSVGRSRDQVKLKHPRHGKILPYPYPPEEKP